MSNSGRSKREAQGLREQLAHFVAPLLEGLDEQLDKRLVRTFLKALEAIISFRHSSYGLLLSELGSYIICPAQALAGTKRLSNLLRSRKWQAEVISDFLWRGAQQRLSELVTNGQDAFLV